MIYGFDLETKDLSPDDRNASYKLGVTCAALADSTKTKAYYPGYLDGYELGELERTLTPSELLGITNDLAHCMSGDNILGTWNGLSFDFRVLYEELEHLPVKYEIARIALTHYDLMFQFLCQRGFPVGLEAVSKPMLHREKIGMHGDEAVANWGKSPEDRRKIITYVMGDAELTRDVLKEVMVKNMISWVTKSGNTRFEGVRKLLTVVQAARLPEPDTSWMDSTLSRFDFMAWIPDVQSLFGHSEVMK